MSGHNKWSQIRYKKGKEDAKRGKAFSKLAKEITVAARSGGGDPGGNNRLRSAIQAAKAVNMPKDTIEQAILRGTGELPGVIYEEIHFEGYGPGGVAVFVEVLTDNHKRSTANVRHIFSKHGGNLGENGCVAWIFERKGQIVVEGSYPEEDLYEIALDSGAEDIELNEGNWEVTCPENLLNDIEESFRNANLPVLAAERALLPTTTADVDERTGEKLLRFLDVLQDDDDVQNVWVNANFVE